MHQFQVDVYNNIVAYYGTCTILLKDCIRLMQMPNTNTETVFVAIRNTLFSVLCQLLIVDPGDVTPSLRIRCTIIL